MKRNVQFTLLLGVVLLSAAACKVLGRQLAVMYRDAWDSGMTKREGAVENGLQTGEWTYYYESGQRRAQGRYEADRRIGPWTHYYEQGGVEWAGEFDSNGRRTGEWQMNYPDATVRARGHYVDDAEEGGWEFFWPDGSLQRTGSFDAGRLSGLWRYYRESGKLEAEGVCHRGQRIGSWRVIDEQGREGSKDFGTRPGITIVAEYWPDGGRRRVGVLENNIPTGCWATWHQNGQPRIACTFRDGAPTGPVTACDVGGSPLARGNLVAGQFAAGAEAYAGGAASSIADVTLPSVAAREEWLADGELSTGQPEQTVAALIGEALAPPRTDAAPTAVAPDQPVEPALPVALAEEVVEQIAEEPVRIAAPMQADWTVTEREELDSYVLRYLDGPDKAPASRKKYGPPGARQQKGPGRRRGLEGKPLPQQVFTGIDGEDLDLRTLRGKKRVMVVILRGFVGEVCVYCVAQTEALAQCSKQLEDLGIEVVVVYPGPRENQESFTKAYEMTFGKGAPPYRIFYDQDLSFVEKLGISGDLAFPTTLIIDQQGDVQYAFVGAHRADRPAAKRLIELIEGMAK